MWKKFVDWSNSSDSSLLLAVVIGACAIFHFGNFVRKEIEESRY